MNWLSKIWLVITGWKDAITVLKMFRDCPKCSNTQPRVLIDDDLTGEALFYCVQCHNKEKVKED